MFGIADSHLKNVVAAVTLVASCTMLGCSSDPPPELTPAVASAVISQRWSRDELNHFTVAFHSDTVVDCGVTNDLWKLTETSERGYTWTTYQLTEKGSKVVFAIDLKGSGKGHVITLRGPYRFEVTGIAPGSQPDTRYVDVQWEIDWSKAPAELKTCVPKFELAGHEVALFKLEGRDWKLASYVKPEDVPPPQTTVPVVDKLP